MIGVGQPPLKSAIAHRFAGCSLAPFFGRRSMTVRASVEPATENAAAGSGLRDAGPPPQRFTVASGQLLEVASAALPAFLRLGSGAVTFGYQVGLVEEDGKYGVVRLAGRRVSETSKVSGLKRPAQTLELYEFEGCPFCKKVRESICMLDLDVKVYPCPKEGTVWRNKAIALGGKKQFPFLVDPNTEKQMYEVLCSVASESSELSQEEMWS